MSAPPRSIWTAPAATLYLFPGEGAVEERSQKGTRFPSLIGPDDFISIETNPELMSFADLSAYIRGLRAQGYDAGRYAVDLYGKLTFPLVNFIMVLLGISFAIRPARRGGIADSVAVSVIVGFSYWVVFAVARSLGQEGLIPPFLAAALPDVLFVAVGIFFLSYVRD